MGMTIDEHIVQLKKLKSFHNGSYGANINFAIDTMRKYQKIQEIARWNNAPSPYYKPDGQLFREICEVLEDGNDDN